MFQLLTFKSAKFKQISFAGLIMICISGCQRNGHSKNVREDARSPVPHSEASLPLDAEFQVVEPYLKSLIHFPAFYQPGPYLKRETRSSYKGNTTNSEVEERLLDTKNQVIKSTITNEGEISSLLEYSFNHKGLNTNHKKKNANGDVLEEVTIEYDEKGNITKKTKITNDPDSDEFGTTTWTLVERQGDFPSENNLRKTVRRVFIPHPEAIQLKGSESTEKIDISGQKLTYWREELIDKTVKRESKLLVNKETRSWENEESVNSKIVSRQKNEFFDPEFRYLKQSHYKEEGDYDRKDGRKLDDETTTNRLIRDQNGKITGYESTTRIKKYKNTKDEKTQTYLPNPPVEHEYESTVVCTLIELGEAKCEENLKVNNEPLPKLDSLRKLCFVKYPIDPIF